MTESDPVCGFSCSIACVRVGRSPDLPLFEGGMHAGFCPDEMSLTYKIAHNGLDRSLTKPFEGKLDDRGRSWLIVVEKPAFLERHKHI